MVSQHATAERLLAEVRSDGHEFDLTVPDLLGYMAVIGVQFASGRAAAVAYSEDGWPTTPI